MSSIASSGGVRVPTAASAARRDGWLRRLPLLPAFVYVVVITQIPFALTIYYSFFSWNLLRPGSFKFTGLDNYANLVTDESIRTAVWNTVLLTISVIGISVVLGLAVATLLNSEVFGKGLMRTLMIAPFLIMPTAGALIWKDTLLNPLFGLLPNLLSPFGLSRAEWVWSSRPRSLRRSGCARCSQSSRWRPGVELSKSGPASSSAQGQGDCRATVPDFESRVVGGRLAGGVRLLLSRPVDVAGSSQD